MSGEHYKGGAEQSKEVERAAAERSAELREQERTAEEHEESQEGEVVKARHEANKEAVFAAEHAPTEGEQPKNTFTASADRQRAYKETMHSIRREMSAPSRAFSKVIHNKTVEQVSDAVGNTIARPNAVLAGAICAFLAVLGLYIHARYIGYALRGSETIVAFIAGWLVGIAFDALRNTLRRKR